MAEPKKAKSISLSEFDAAHAQALDDAMAHPDKYARAGERLDGNPIALGPRISTPEEWTADYMAGVSNNAGKWLRRATAPSKNPVTEAIKAADTWKTSIQEAITKDRFRKGLAQVDVDGMIETITAVGEAGYIAGVQARAKKIGNKQRKLQALISAHAQVMDQLPTTTSQQRRDKMLKNLDGMLAVGDKMKGG